MGMKSNLKKHKRKVHGAVFSNDVSCKTCGRRYENRDSLRKHTKRGCAASGSTTEKWLSCDKCDFRTRHVASLRRHNKKAHNQFKDFHAFRGKGIQDSKGVLMIVILKALTSSLMIA